MAPTPITCSATGCSYNTPMGAELKDMLEFMKLHTQQAHPPTVPEPTVREARATTKVDKRPRPVIQEEMSEHDWRFFQSEWQDYTRATGVTGQHLLDELWSCMSADLRRLAFNQGSKEDLDTELKMMERIRGLAVSVLHAAVHTVALHEARQSPGESTKAFAARVRGTATNCNLVKTCECSKTVSFLDETVYHVVLAGLHDSDMQERALSAAILKTITDTASLVEFCSAEESDYIANLTHYSDFWTLVRKAMKNRPDLKVIITSATLNSEKFRQYFDCCPVLNIPGFMFPVEIIYCKTRGERGLVAGAMETDYLKKVVDKIEQIHIDNDGTDGMLVFLPGYDEIAAVSNSHLKTVPGLHIITLHASMPVELQVLVFTAMPTVRKLVLATNVAETTLTIPGIKYVVDSGYFKENTYDPQGQMDRLVVTPISCAQATQRAGRAGRVGPGVCYRMYGEREFREMRERPIPAICRSDIVTVCLLLKAIGIKNIIAFGFLDPPVSTLVHTALTTLMRLDALDNQEVITTLGKTMADFPINPVLAKMLVSSVELGDQVLTVVSMLSVKNVFVWQKKGSIDEDRLKMTKQRMSDPSGDHLTLLNIFTEWVLCGCSPAWSADHCLNQKELERAADIRGELARLMNSWDMPLTRVPRHMTNLVLQAVCAGLKAVDKVATLHWSSLNYVRTKDMMNVWIHPSSILFNPNNEYQPKTIIYHEIVTTKKNYMRHVSAVKPEWIKN